MSDDGWRDHYEEYWDEDDPRDGCAHEEYDVDWEGRAECIRCNERWWLTDQQLEAHHEAEARWHEEYARMQRRENSRFWQAVDWLSAFASRARYRFRRKATVTTDDELPF